MTTTLETVSRNAAADAIVDLLDAGAGAATAQCRDGATLIVQFTLSDPAFGAAAAGVATLAGTPIAQAAVAAGDVDSVEFRDSDDNVVFTGDAGLIGSGAAVEMSNTNLAISQIASLDSGTFTVPATD